MKSNAFQDLQKITIQLDAGDLNWKNVQVNRSPAIASSSAPRIGKESANKATVAWTLPRPGSVCPFILERITTFLSFTASPPSARVRLTHPRSKTLLETQIDCFTGEKGLEGFEDPVFEQAKFRSGAGRQSESEACDVAAALTRRAKVQRPDESDEWFSQLLNVLCTMSVQRGFNLNGLKEMNIDPHLGVLIDKGTAIHDHADGQYGIFRGGWRGCSNRCAMPDAAGIEHRQNPAG